MFRRFTGTSIRCLVGIHDFNCLTSEHGFVVNNGLTDDDAYDTKEFLHVGECVRCGQIHAFVSLLYFTQHDPAWFRNPTEEELETFFAAEAAKLKKTDRQPLQHIDVKA